MPNAEIADWCHEARYIADLVQERGGDPEVVTYLRNASKYAAAFKLAQSLDSPPGEDSWLLDAFRRLAESVPPTGTDPRDRDAWRETCSRLAQGEGWLTLFRALTIQE